jgi:asparagine synthase (glutamine-hydrolysing)
MCGICGKLEFSHGAKVSPSLIKAMADTIVHRGPDDEGFHVSGQIGLGFRRLSIIDLRGGHQPLSNEDGSVWVIFNGEIYNYQELRKRLLEKGHIFRTNTDTEVLVHLYEEHGEGMVQQLRGMFAFALWDEPNKSLLLARDRVGIKPLYYHLSPHSLVFASEIKAILADPAVQPEINVPVIDRFFSFYYVPGEETLLKGICKLAPGHYMLIKQGQAQIRQYWDLHFPDQTGGLNLKRTEEELLHLLDETVRLHMISDVPVGFLLSGGVDSTAMLRLATGKTDQAISSYTVGFCEPGVTDERPYARLAASVCGSEHHEITITSKDFADFLPQYMWHMEEPVCEPPAVALYYISKFARQFVTVLISGEGGDEAFAGYQNYRNLLWLERLKKLPSPFRQLLFGTLSGIGRLTYSRKLAYYSNLAGIPFESYYYSRTSGPTLLFNRQGSSPYSKEFAEHIDKQASLSPVNKYLQKCAGKDMLSRMLYVDTKTWLPDDLLLKADKITMANSLELRVPLLDHKVLEFAAALPSNFKVHNFTTKYIAKRALGGLVPKEILNRKKTGFPVPYELWMRTGLKDWVHQLLFDQKTLDRGYFDRNKIERMLLEDQQQGGFSKEIFSLVALELWHRMFLEKKNPVFA